MTTRQTRRWVIPKGWPERDLTHWDAAAMEAVEEAGVHGRIDQSRFGSYLYWKRMADHFSLIHADVFLLEVDQELEEWREMHERERRWMSVIEASEEVLEPGLVSLFRKLEEFNAARTDGLGTMQQMTSSPGYQRPAP